MSSKGLYSSIVDISEEHSYLVPNQDLRGVGQPYVKGGDFLQASLPIDPAAIQGQSVTLAAIPSPITGKYIHLPDGNVSAPGLAWAGEVTSGRYRLGAANAGESILGTAVFDWNASQFHFATGYRTYWGTTSSIFPGTQDYLAVLASQNSALRATLRNTSGGASSHATFATMNDTGDDCSFGIVGSAFSGDAILSTGDGFVGLSNPLGNLSSSNDMWLYNRFSSGSIKFATNNAFAGCFNSSGFFGVNTLTPRRRIDSLSTSAPQLRLSYSDNTQYTDFQTDSGGDLTITPTGGDVIITGNVNPTANYFWKSGTAFTGELDHANSANRVYTFPNATGTVMLTSTGTGLFTQGSVPFADSGGLLTENNASFFWDNTNNILKLGPSGIGHLQCATSHGPFDFVISEATFSGTIDSVLHWGYNYVRSTVTEPSYMLSIESSYNDGATIQMEMNWDYTSSDGLTTKRFFSQQIDRASHVSNIYFAELETFKLKNSSIDFVSFIKSTQLTTFFNAAGVGKIILDTTTNPALTVNSIVLSGNGTQNTFCGNSSGNFTLSGSFNTAFGSTSLPVVSSGADNSAFGVNALSLVSSGSSNTAMGSGALKTIATVSNCSAFGTNALLTTTGANNNAFGSASAQKTTTGAANCSFGTSSLFNNLTGSNNTCFGHQTLNACTVDGNSAFGYQAGLQISSGTGNSAFGFQCLLANQTGSENSAFGNAALGAMTSTKGSAFGFNSLDSATGAENTAFGNRTGRTVTTGTKNTFLGASANVSVNNLTLVTCLGYSASASASSTMVLGGTGANAISAVIGGTAASARFHVIEATAGSEVFRAETIATNDDPNYRIFQNRAATTDATQTTLDTITITASNTYRIKSYVVARRTGGSAGTAEDAAGYEIEATYKTVGGVVTLVGAVAALYTAEDQAGWDATFDINAATVRVRVTGATNNNVTWHSTTILSNLGT